MIEDSVTRKYDVDEGPPSIVIVSSELNTSVSFDLGGERTLWAEFDNDGDVMPCYPRGHLDGEECSVQIQVSKGEHCLAVAASKWWLAYKARINKTERKIVQEFSCNEPCQFLGIVKGVAGPERDDFMLAYPMIDGYSVTLSADRKKVTIELDLSEAEIPVDWCTPENLSFKQTLPTDGEAFKSTFLPQFKG